MRSHTRGTQWVINFGTLEQSSAESWRMPPSTPVNLAPLRFSLLKPLLTLEWYPFWHVATLINLSVFSLSYPFFPIFLLPFLSLLFSLPPFFFFLGGGGRALVTPEGRDPQSAPYAPDIQTIWINSIMLTQKNLIENNDANTGGIFWSTHLTHSVTFLRTEKIVSSLEESVLLETLLPNQWTIWLKYIKKIVGLLHIQIFFDYIKNI